MKQREKQNRSTGMTRNNVAKALRRYGYDWQDWNEDGTILEASKTCAGITIDTVTVNFTANGRAMC